MKEYNVKFIKIHKHRIKANSMEEAAFEVDSDKENDIAWVIDPNWRTGGGRRIMSVYALSDLHGNEILFNKILNFLTPNDKVYFLGDAADRGKVGFGLIKQIYEDPRFIYVKGNWFTFL